MSSIRELLIRVLEQYPIACRQDFTGHPIGALLREEFPAALRERVQDQSYLIEGSIGKGRWADTPWVALMDSNVTDSVQRGHYVVYLFRGDGSGVYLSLNQGVTDIHESVKSQYLSILETNARALAVRVPRQEWLGLHSGRIDLHSARWRSKGYCAGNVADRFYGRGSVPDEEELNRDLARFKRLYQLTTAAKDQIAETQEPFGTGIEPGSLRWHLRVERNTRLTGAAKRILGYRCQVCSFDFERVYGSMGAGFIEAHHLTPLREVRGRPTALNPATDFAVVCSNCHSMLHRGDGGLTVQRLKVLLDRAD